MLQAKDGHVLLLQRRRMGDFTQSEMRIADRQYHRSMVN